MKLTPLFLAAACGSAALAQTSFRAFDSSEEMLEGGTAHTLVVDAGREHLVARVPRGYSATVDAAEQSVVLKEDAGSITFSLQVTTNSPGVMPEDDTLRAKALAADPGGNFLQIAGCATGYKPARFVDTTRNPDPLHTLRARHAYVPCPEGIVEFRLVTKEEDFDKGRAVFNLFLTSFRLEIIKEPAKPPD
jgi:hypothetical protein